MKLGRSATSAVLACWLLAAGEGHAKTFRYDGGPQAPADTALSIAQPSLEPIVRARGPRVPLTNLQLVSLVANSAFDRALATAPLDSGTQVLLAPAENHPLNFVVEHAILKYLARRHVTAQVRRTQVPDDSVLTAHAATDPILEFQVASARVTYVRLRGWLPGRVKIERQALVEGRLTLRDPAHATVMWVGDASHNLMDAFPRGQQALVEDERFADLKAQAPGRTVDKVVEPVIVAGIVTGLIALFFQNRP